MTAKEPINQAMTAAGPPMVETNSAPNSQPEPMMEPSDVKSSPMKPASRLSPSSS